MGDDFLLPQHVLSAMAKYCRSCPECGESPPCQTCMAGGVCLAHCSCDEDERDIGGGPFNDDDDDTDTAAKPEDRR